METATMGKTPVTATIENQYDLYEVSKGLRKPEEVRRIEVTDALADTGATMLMVPRRYIQELGLQSFNTRRAQTVDNMREFQVYALVQLTIQGRSCPLDVAEIPDDRPVLIGQIPLERLDFVVDPVQGKLIPNPAHGGEFMIEAY